MAAENDPRSKGNTALNVHKSRLKKLKLNQKKSILNQGKGVDRQIRALTKKYSEIKAEEIKQFSDFPLSNHTQEGLESAKFSVPTEIQREAIGLALQGHDILGAAKTGSGKTLAFLIPVLELLYRNKVGFLDGMSALIVSPTRELAYQTYSVLKKIGFRHDFSAGLIIGGKDLKEESERISRTHIVVATPGRLQQHMEQTWGFNADNLQMLVLDECDRILDMGFQDTMNAIIDYLPTERQTLMFSATQTKSVSDLARVGLKSPLYVSVHEKADQTTPATLEQSYIVCDLHDKLNTLWFFVKHHLKSKILVFLQSAKQVRYIHDAFSRVRPGVTLLALHGAMKQTKRVKTYDVFCRKQFVVLFATDLAARGLDFPGVNWVVQFDAPEDTDTYIHRVGRTARYESDGEALIFLLPSEKQEMLKNLQTRKIPIAEIQVNPKKMGDITRKMASQLVEDPDLKEFAKACFISYIKGYFLMKNKEMFDISNIDTTKYAQSLGLVLIPRIRFLQKHEKMLREKEEKLKEKENKNVKKLAESSSEDESENNQSDGDADSDSQSENGSDGESDKSDDSADAAEGTQSDEDSDDDLLKLKPSKIDKDTPSSIKLTLQEELEKKSKEKNRAISKKDLAQAMKKKGISAKRTVFSGDEDTSGSDDEMEDEGNKLDLEAARRRIEEQDADDKEAERARVKRKHQERRWKEKEERRAAAAAAKRPRTADDEDDSEDEYEAVLGTPSDNSDMETDPDIQENSHSDSNTKKPRSNHRADKNDQSDRSEQSDQSEHDRSDQSDSDNEQSDQSESEHSNDEDDSYDEAEANTEGHKLDDDEAFALQLLRGKQ